MDEMRWWHGGIVGLIGVIGYWANRHGPGSTGTRWRKKRRRMANFKRKRPKNRRSGCLMCKPHKMNGWKKEPKYKGSKRGAVEIQ